MLYTEGVSPETHKKRRGFHQSFSWFIKTLFKMAERFKLSASNGRVADCTHLIVVVIVVIVIIGWRSGRSLPFLLRSQLIDGGRLSSGDEVGFNAWTTRTMIKNSIMSKC